MNTAKPPHASIARASGRSTTARTALTIAALLTLGAGMVAAVVFWNPEFIYYGLTLLAICAGVWLLDRQVTLPIGVLWGLYIWLVLHLAGGIIQVPAAIVDTGMTNYSLYNVRLHPWLPRYDQFVHAFGFFLCTLGGWRALFVAGHRLVQPALGPLIGAGLIGMGCGGVNEVIEFVGTQIMPGTNVGGYVNTGWDLVSNMVGCLLGMALVALTHERWFARP
jgi:hypothetical protein